MVVVMVVVMMLVVVYGLLGDLAVSLVSDIQVW